MLKEIRGMACDMTHLWLMEQNARLSRFGSFFIPHSAFRISYRSTHAGVNLLRLNPVRSMLMFQVYRVALLFSPRGERIEAQSVPFRTALRNTL
jgi:hypothetical protein